MRRISSKDSLADLNLTMAILNSIKLSDTSERTDADDCFLYTDWAMSVKISYSVLRLLSGKSALKRDTRGSSSDNRDAMVSSPSIFEV
jgi:hypothetical protein